MLKQLSKQRTRKYSLPIPSSAIALIINGFNFSIKRHGVAYCTENKIHLFVALRNRPYHWGQIQLQDERIKEGIVSK